ncbi:hypothetical protein IBX38_07045 [Candidatus Bathyarchaeota archaeon]|nr:hypothetical protein [Candidatus Bathyarchaeota archaeon]
MPKKRKKRKDIVVPAPHFRSEKEALLKDTTGVEAFDVFKVSEKIGRRLSGLMIAVGALLSLFSLVSILTSIKFTFSNPIFLGALGFLGAINIFCGLMLLAKK